jgi:hypothetical protein
MTNRQCSFTFNPPIKMCCSNCVGIKIQFDPKIGLEWTIVFIFTGQFWNVITIIHAFSAKL